MHVATRALIECACRLQYSYVRIAIRAYVASSSAALELAPAGLIQIKHTRSYIRTYSSHPYIHTFTPFPWIALASESERENIVVAVLPSG